VSPEKRAMPKWTKAPEALVDLFNQIEADLQNTESRKMFGYPCAFSANQMFFGVFQNSMFLRLSEFDRRAFLQQYGTKLFEPMPGRPMKEYAVVPETLLKAPKELKKWIDKSRTYVSQLPAKPPKTKKASSSKTKK
jgi:TfoX/Sxy family transcriptional regulator of competence genes